MPGPARRLQQLFFGAGCSSPRPAPQLSCVRARQRCLGGAWLASPAAERRKKQLAGEFPLRAQRCESAKRPSVTCVAQGDRSTGSWLRSEQQQTREAVMGMCRGRTLPGLGRAVRAVGKTLCKRRAGCACPQDPSTEPHRTGMLSYKVLPEKPTTPFLGRWAVKVAAGARENFCEYVLPACLCHGGSEKTQRCWQNKSLQLGAVS